MNFQTTPNGREAFDQRYGAAAYTLADQLSFIYFRAAGVEPSHWESRLYANGLVALAPVATDPQIQAAFDSVELAEAHAKAFARAMEGLSAHGCSNVVFEVLRTAEEQILELHPPV